MQDDIIRRPPAPMAAEPPVVAQQNTEPRAPTTEVAPEDSQQKVPVGSKSKSRANSPTAVIVVAVFICLLLVGATIYVGTQTQA